VQHFLVVGSLGMGGGGVNLGYGDKGWVLMEDFVRWGVG
jgi:hypothetical protein